jgi:hypothetical protein
VNELERLAVQTAMKKLLSSTYFDITALRNCLEIAGVIPDGKTMRALNVLHCVHYADMPKELLEQLPETIVSLFKGVVFDTDRLNIVLAGSGLKMLSNK